MRDPHTMKILYLEDDSDTIDLVTFTLEREGMTVVSVPTAEEALERALTEDFDLYMLDGLTESGYSFELCRQLREHNPEVPVVFYTALGFPQDKEKGAAAGADAYLVKPFVGDLATTLRQTVEKTRSKKTPPGQYCGGTFLNTVASLG